MSTATSSNMMILLKSSDGETFEVEESVAEGSEIIKHMIDDDCAGNAIPLPNITAPILAMVITYLKRHSSNDDEEKLKSFDSEFVNVDQATLYDLILGANYLNIKGLLDLTTQTVADMIKGKSVEKIREIFNIKNDFTPEEEAEIRQQNAWAFE